MKEAQRQEFFERLVRDYSAEFYRFAFLQTGQAEAAEDIVQEAYYEAWRSIGRLRDPEKARAWLFQILRHRYAHSRLIPFIHLEPDLNPSQQIFIFLKRSFLKLIFLQLFLLSKLS